MAAGEIFGQYLAGTGTDNLLELTRAERERIFNLGYFTWVEQQGLSVEEFRSRHEAGFWEGIHPMVGVWDDMIIDEQGLSEMKYTDRLLKEIKDNNWERLAGGEPTAWANISHQYAVDALVPNGALITQEYVTEESKIVDAQLALGGAC